MFAEAVEVARGAGLDPRWRHLANSAGTLTGAAPGEPDVHLDLVRPGIAVYGVSPGPDVGTPAELGLRPAMTLRGRVALVKRAPAGEGVSYWHRYTTPRETTLALVPLGYADGVPRAGTNRLQLFVGGRRRTVAGTVCMDQVVLDVQDDDVRAGDEVLLFGPGDRGEATAEDWAQAIDTIAYEGRHPRRCPGAPPPRRHRRPAVRLARPTPGPDVTTAAAAGCGSLPALAATVVGCTACPELASSRQQVVVGEPARAGGLLLVGEAPGAQEDASGRPFVGRAGQLLDECLAEAGLSRADVGVLNTLKCRPPGNRRPTADESRRCAPWLTRQLALAAPSLVVAMGTTSAAWFLGPRAGSLASLRGRVHEATTGQAAGQRVLVTYHPSAALRWGPAGAPRAALVADLRLAGSAAAA